MRSNYRTEWHRLGLAAIFLIESYAVLIFPQVELVIIIVLGDLECHCPHQQQPAKLILWLKRFPTFNASTEKPLSSSMGVMR
jgi:hypothetical protein